MNYDTIAVILTVAAGWYATHRDIAQLRDRMSTLETELKERMARLEGLFESFTSRRNKQQEVN